MEVEEEKEMVELEEKRRLVGQPHMDRHDECGRGLGFGWEAERYLGPLKTLTLLVTAFLNRLSANSIRIATSVRFSAIAQP